MGQIANIAFVAGVALVAAYIGLVKKEHIGKAAHEAAHNTGERARDFARHNADLHSRRISERKSF
ncbi:hypothetical protein KJ807_05650 [Patescibacteria group bacterium]|nr:hypothetical protein [Patescibacteria group bacterium]